MITLSPLGGNSIEFDNGSKKLAVFVEPSVQPEDGTITMYGTPQDEPVDGSISWPGEYDYEGIAITGIGHEEGETVSYVVQFDGIRVGFLHAPLHDWTDHELELLGDIDILCIPAKDPKAVQKLVDEIEPRVLIPLKTGADDKYAEVLKAVGAQAVEPSTSYKTKGSLPSEGREVVVFEA